MSSSISLTILLVDGYNIIGLWSELRDLRDRHGLEPARRELIERLVGYSAFHNLDTRVVFDSHYRHDRGNCEMIVPNLQAIYTDFGQTADTYIEKTCALFNREEKHRKRRAIVATSDRAQQLTVIGYGAEWMSAQQLASEVEGTASRVRRTQKNTLTRSPSRFLSSSLDPDARQRLARLRMGLG
jgi:uncharacterized protein